MGSVLSQIETFIEKIENNCINNLSIPDTPVKSVIINIEDDFYERQRVHSF